MAPSSTSPGAGSSKNPSYKGGDAKAGASFNAGFAPSFGINLNVGNGSHNGSHNSGGSGSGSGQIQTNASHFILGEPEFAGTDQVIQYCNHVRAVMVQAAIELAVAAKILEARLAQAAPVPGENVFQRRIKARQVAGKLKKAADGATAAAKSAVGTYAALQREYQDLMRPRLSPANTNPFRF
jgi:hypothetical protein